MGIEEVRSAVYYCEKELRSMEEAERLLLGQKPTELRDKALKTLQDRQAAMEDSLEHSRGVLRKYEDDPVGYEQVELLTSIRYQLQDLTDLLREYIQRGCT